MAKRLAAGYYVETDDRRGTIQYWLTVQLADGWLAAYRVIFHGDGARRRARIGELRIVPYFGLRAGGFSPTYGTYESYAAPFQAEGRPIPPFAFEAVRRKITPRFFADALAASASLQHAGDDMDWPPAAVDEPSVPARRRPGRPARDPRFYATFAVAYHAIEHGDRREPGASTREILKRRYKVPVTTIGKWIRIARQHKFLTPVRSGQRGGQATRSARDLAGSPK